MLLLQVMLPLFCYCQLDNFAWGTRGIDATETNGQDCKDLVAKKPYEVGCAPAQQPCIHSPYKHHCSGQHLHCSMAKLHAASSPLYCYVYNRCTPCRCHTACVLPSQDTARASLQLPLSSPFYIATALLLCSSNAAQTCWCWPCYTFVSTKLMATAGGLQVHETPHKQAQRLCNKVHGAGSLPHSQYGHWVCHCHHHNLVLVGLHDDGHPPVPAGSPHHHFWAVPYSLATVLTPPQTPEEAESCQSCSACRDGCTTRQ